MKFKVDALSDKGEWREDNEDRFIVRTGKINNVRSGIFAVSDGVGGLPRGEVASQMIIESLQKWWENIKDNGVNDIVDDLSKTIDNTDKKLKAYGKENNLKFAATLTVLLIHGNEGHVFHIGDTKVVKVCSDGKTVKQLTIDQKKKQEPNGKYYLTQCLGSVKKSYVLIEDHFPVTDGEHYFIGSDGAFNTGLKENLPALMTNKDICREILKFARSNGETDNITIICLSIAE